jgi:hypothetical protein
MLKRCLLSFIAVCFSLCLQAMHNPEPKTNSQQTNQQSQSGNRSISQESDEKHEIMEQDEIDNSDALAIPLDYSSIEDEEELDRLRREPFTPLNPVPQNPDAKSQESSQRN